MYQQPSFEPEPEPEWLEREREQAVTRDRLAIKLLEHVRDALDQTIHFLEQGQQGKAAKVLTDFVKQKQETLDEMTVFQEPQTIEGVFDGCRMIAADGEPYAVPEKYASKLRLVEGDLLLRYLRANGLPFFQPIAPVERSELTGILQMDDQTQMPVVLANDRLYHVLPASVEYYKGIAGDEVVILVPSDGESTWAAVQQIIKK